MVPARCGQVLIRGTSGRRSTHKGPERGLKGEIRGAGRESPSHSQMTFYHAGGFGL